MADFSALKQSIQNYIKQNGNKEITGAILQNILLSMVTTMGDGAINGNASDISDIKGDIQNINGDITNINSSITDINGDITELNGDLSDEVNRAEGAEGILQQNITAEENRAKGAETTTVIFSDGKLVFKNAAGTVLYQLSVDSFLSAITTRLNTGALYAGYATPSTTPATLTSQEVFYLATQAGTYTNFHFNGGDDPIVLTKDGIYFIVSGDDDDDWNAEPMLQLDDVPTASSNNAVKSGGVAEELALGAVYDVSAKNPTAGPNNDGKWESLSALFSDANLSTLIPASVRKGGMSIKFVQSSDNKYVQYRLMADDWSTTEADWQGVDDIPTTGSDNLVKSGGVNTSIDNIKERTFKTTNKTAILGEPLGNGVVTSDDTRCYVILNPNNVTSVSVPEGFLLILYGLDNGIEGTWELEGGWTQQENISNWEYPQVGIKICKTNDTDSIDADERKDILTTINSNSLESKIQQETINRQRAINDIAFNTGEKINQIGIDDEPAAGSDNLVKSSGVYNPVLNIKTNTENTVLCSAMGIGEPMGSGIVTPDSTRAYLYFDKDIVEEISIKPGFMVYIYAVTDGLDGDWDTISGYISGWTTSQVIPELSSSYKGIGIKICKTVDTDTITLDELKDAITVITRNNLKQDVSDIKGFSEGCYYGENKIKFKAGDLVNDTTNYDTTRGHVIIPAAGLKRIIADSSHKIYCFGNDTESYQGATNYSIDRGGWSRLFDMQGFNHKYLIMLLCKDVDTDRLSEEELENSVYYECASILENANQYIVASSEGYQITDDGNFYSLDNKLTAGKRYKVSIVFDGFVSSDFVDLANTGDFGLYDFSMSNAQWYETKDFNNGRGLTLNGKNTFEFTPIRDFFYVRLSSVVKSTFVGNYTQKVKFEFYEVSDADNLVTKQDIIQKENIGINVFGDVLPPLFKNKLLEMSGDLLITCVGDSLTGAVDYSGQVENPTHAAPGHQFNDWVTQMLSIVNKNKPQNDRLDSVRDNSSVFTKVGTWDITNYDTFSPDSDIYFGDFSWSAETFRSSDNNAQVQFVWDLDAFAKCNIVTAKSIDGVLSQIVISEGNGKVLVSEDRTNWIEANGFTFSQRSNPTGKTDDELKAAGEAKYERHRRLWMKKVEGVTGTITVTYKRDNSTSYSNSYMYCWGVERYSYPAIFFDNIGRGGRFTQILNWNSSDIFDRHPDLVIYEMPIANEQNYELNRVKGWYNDYFNSNNINSFKTKSNNYQDVPILAILPHCRAGYFDDNNSAIKFMGYGEPPTDLPSYYFAKSVYSNLMSIFNGVDNANIINLLDYILDECIKNFGKINIGLGGNVPYGYTVDSIHLSKYGAQKYVKYLAPIFYV